MGCHTMLKSEKAALAKVIQLEQELLQNRAKKYIDPDFGPSNLNDEKGNKMCVYKSGFPSVKGQTEPEDIVWLHPESYCEG